MHSSQTEIEYSGKKSQPQKEKGGRVAYDKNVIMGRRRQ